MPIYEEKLVSPLAIRFTQEHIKTLFRDKHVVEKTAEQIQMGPGAEGYDVVLKAPFPAIEIIRWCAPGAKENESHWFTLDNRRLYCLQRAAARAWPKRVAARVEILYCDPGAVWRKYDSTTFGASVTVSHSTKEAMLFRWDWRSEIANAKFVDPSAEVKDGHEAMAAVLADDKKDTVDALLDVPCGASCPAERAREALEAMQRGSSSASSTAPPSEEGDDLDDRRSSSTRSAGDISPSNLKRPTPQKKSTAGNRRHVDPALVEKAIAEISTQLRADGDGRVRIPRWSERFGVQLGGMRHFLESHPEAFTVATGKAGQWTVELVGGTRHKQPAPAPPRSEPKLAAAPAAPAHLKSGGISVAERGIAEIRAHLDPNGAPGYVQIPDWNRRFMRHLGQLRDFAESRPDLFSVIPCGKGFRIARVDRLIAAQRSLLAAQIALHQMQTESIMAGAGLLASQSAFC